MTDHRSAILDWAKSQVGPGDRAAYWVSALGHDPGPKLAWCGAFCLAALHAAGVAPELKWTIGIGFIGPAHLKTTQTPSRGDICYLDQPFQHHFLFDYEYDGWIYSVDGNQPDVRQRKRRREGIHFYGISPLLPPEDQDTDPGSPKHPTLRIGAHGEPVKLMQALLNAANPNGHPIAEDGAFGSVTAAVLQSFQRRAGLDADAVCGPRTWGALEHK